MNLVEKIKNLFTRKQIDNEEKRDYKTLDTVNVYDDVILVIDDIFYNGWVSGKTKNHLLIVYDSPTTPLTEILFAYGRPLNRSIVTYNNMTLYLNKYEYK